MSYLLLLSRCIDALTRRIAVVVVWCTLIMVILSFSNAVLRRIGRTIGENLTWGLALDLQWILFGFMFLMAGGYTILTDSNVRVDIFYRNLTPRQRSMLEAISAIFFIIPFAALVIWMSWPMVVNSISVWERSTVPGGVSPWLIRPIIPIAFLLILAQGISVAIKQIAFLTGTTSDPNETVDS